MKLVYCTNCHQVFSLTFAWKFCDCRKAKGRYLEDGLHAEIQGTAIPIGFHNTSFFEAVKAKRGTIVAFVIPETAKTVQRIP